MFPLVDLDLFQFGKKVKLFPICLVHSPLPLNFQSMISPELFLPNHYLYHCTWLNLQVWVKGSNSKDPLPPTAHSRTLPAQHVHYPAK